MNIQPTRWIRPLRTYAAWPASAIELLTPLLLTSMLLGHVAVAQAAGQAPAPGQRASLSVPASGSATSSPADDIHDIRGPKPIASGWLTPLIVLTAVLAAGGAYASWAWNRRRLQRDDKRPYDIALERLEKARALMLPESGRAFSIDVSSTVRDYIESRFEVRAAHLTTDEFLRSLLEPGDSLLITHRGLLDEFLQTCDLAKFGGWTLSPGDMDTMWESARRFVAESAPADEPAAARHGGISPAPRSAAPRKSYASVPST